MIKLKDAILKLMPTAEFTVFNENEIIWGENCLNNHPTEKAIQAKLADLQADYDSKSYARERQQKFPNDHDLLIALWEKVVEDRSESADALQAIRTQIKSDNPKP